jgi:hypothetical protein
LVAGGIEAGVVLAWQRRRVGLARPEGGAANAAAARAGGDKGVPARLPSLAACRAFICSFFV